MPCPQIFVHLGQARHDASDPPEDKLMRWKKLFDEKVIPVLWDRFRQMWNIAQKERKLLFSTID